MVRLKVSVLVTNLSQNVTCLAAFSACNSVTIPSTCQYESRIVNTYCERVGSNDIVRFVQMSNWYIACD